MSAMLQDNCVSAPGETIEFGENFRVATDAPVNTICTKFGDFSDAELLLSDRPLRRSRRPLKRFTNDELKAIAKQNPPPAEWFVGETERPF